MSHKCFNGLSSCVGDDSSDNPSILDQAKTYTDSQRIAYTEKVYLYPETKVTGGSSDQDAVLLDGVELVQGETYNVNLDGVEYNRIACEDEGTVFIGDMIIGGTDPFAVLTVDFGEEGIMSVLLLNDTDTHSFSLVRSYIKTIEPKYLPNGGEGVGYTDNGDTIETLQLTAIPDYGMSTLAEDNFTNKLLTVGETYTIVLDSGTYTAVCKQNDACAYIGNLSLADTSFDNTGETFVYAETNGNMYRRAIDANGGLKMSICTPEIVHQINSKYLQSIYTSVAIETTLPADGSPTDLSDADNLALKTAFRDYTGSGRIVRISAGWAEDMRFINAMATLQLQKGYWIFFIETFVGSWTFYTTDLETWSVASSEKLATLPSNSEEVSE